MKYIVIIGIVAFSLGCKSELDNKVKAKVGEAKEIVKVEKKDEKKDDTAAAKTLDIDSASSTLGFVGAKAVGDHAGNFKEFTGQVKVKAGKVEGLNFAVITTSLVMDKGDLNDEYHKKLEKHMRSGDFFDVAKFPKASFESTSIEEKKSGDFTHSLTGNLNLRGVKKSITFPATINVDGGKVSAKTNFKINRSDFGITYKGMADDLIKEEVLLKVEFKTKG